MGKHCCLTDWNGFLQQIYVQLSMSWRRWNSLHFCSTRQRSRLGREPGLLWACCWINITGNKAKSSHVHNFPLLISYVHQISLVFATFMSSQVKVGHDTAQLGAKWGLEVWTYKSENFESLTSSTFLKSFRRVELNFVVWISQIIIKIIIKISNHHQETIIKMANFTDVIFQCEKWQLKTSCQKPLHHWSNALKSSFA